VTAWNRAATYLLGKPGGPPRRGVAGCTTGQWLAAWLAGRQSLRPLTRRSYQHHLDTYLLPCIGNIPLAMLTAADLRVMFTAIARRRPAVTGDPGADPRHAAGGAERGDGTPANHCSPARWCEAWSGRDPAARTNNPGKAKRGHGRCAG
jgi:hypothetical protein